MMGGGGVVYFVAPKRWIRIPRDEIRCIEYFDDYPGSRALKVYCNDLQNAYWVGHDMRESDGTVPRPDAEARAAARLKIIDAWRDAMYRDLTFHEIDADVTWTWSVEREAWERADGRPAAPAES